PQAEQADVIVLNTCVVRQSAEDKAYGRLTSLRPLKESRPDLVINLMGCLVGVRGNTALRQAFPYVDVFSPPSDPGPLIKHLLQRDGQELDQAEVGRRYALMDGELPLPADARGRLASAFVPIVYGCSHACAFCIIPFRRGVERSRPAAEIVAEVRSLASQGVKEVTLLGQIVDRYGKDIPNGPDLARLLRQAHQVEGIERIRFLTSHPNWMTDELLETVAELPKVCEHIEVPVQAGDDEVLAAMRRGYTADDYRRLIERIRWRLPQASIATDVIVGFPGETPEQFQRTYDLLAELRLDVAHLARYSPRPGTVAARRMPDDVSEEEKEQRFRALEELQASVAAEINASYLGRQVEVLVEEQARGRWKGRTRTSKLVFFDSDADLRGKLVPVRVQWTGPWSLIGEWVLAASPARIPLSLTPA
ncbi:MAG: MiaB/RimO family radical SAM methylthiotransferase, partial [Chloroflexota bacterium]